MPENRQPVAIRRKRYERSPPQEKIIGLTPTKVRMLRFLAELRFLSLPQLARLCCPSERQDLSEKSARRHTRELFDAGLVNVLPVSRAALAPPGVPNDASLLYGSAPNVYAPTAQGLKLLREAGIIGEELLKQPAPAYGPRNSLFLAHELAVRDVHVWLERAADDHGHKIERWEDGGRAAIDLKRSQMPLSVRPDAWFVYRMGETVLVGLVEMDRGTERGDRRWGEKLEAYAALFAAQELLQATTGYVNARVLVITPSARRRNALANLLAEEEEALASKFWFTEQSSMLGETRLGIEKWSRPRYTGLHGLVPG